MTDRPLPVSIRAYRAADASALARLYFDSVRTLGPRAYSQAQVEAWAPAPAEPAAVHARAADGRLTLVAVDAAGQVLGYGDLEADGHIDHLYCRPEAAGAGVGSLLITQLAAQAQAAGMRRLYVEASELARPVFARHGFALVRRRDFDLSGVAIHNYAMERVLA